MTNPPSRTTMPNTSCTHPANDFIEAVAFGFASEEERQLVLEHVSTCEICAAAWEDARFAAVVLPLAAPACELPDSVWAGIEARIADTAMPTIERAISSPAAPSQPAPFRVHWAVAAVLALLTLAGGILLGRAVFETESDVQTPTIAQVTVTDPEIEASGTVQYDAEQGVLVLHMEDLPSAPEGFVYQVWVIDGETPVSVGVMDSANFATAQSPENFQTLAVTLEEGPLGNAQPTTDPIVVADLTVFNDD